MEQYIYGLFNPENDKCFYVGLTGQKLSKRLNGHCNSNDKNIEKTKIIQELIQKGIRPQILLLETVISDNIFEGGVRELHWIKKFLNEGCYLTNKSMNGSGRKVPKDKKIPITIYIDTVFIEKHGGKDATREILMAKIYDNHDSPLINAARGRDESGINKDEVPKKANVAPKPKNLSNLPQKEKEGLNKAKNVDTDIPPMPIREKDEDPILFAARKNEWKLKYNQ